MRLIDISKYEVLSFQDKSQDFVDGVQWILEQMDKESTVKAIPLDKVEQIRAEIADYGTIWVEYKITGHRDKDIEQIVEDVLKQAKEQVLGVIDKAIKEVEQNE